MKKPVIMVITGPTATGKTALAVELSTRLGGEVISADSVQVYRGLDIGSAKPTVEERRGIPHHLIDVCDTGTVFSAGMFQALAKAAIDDILTRGNLPVLTGGTGLYINSIVYPLNFAGTGGDAELRAALESEEKASPGVLMERLRALDPEAAKRIHPNNTKRIARALEVNLLTGERTGGDFKNENGAAIDYEPFIVGLTMPRERLYSRINARVDAMMAAGLLDETRKLAEADHAPKLPAMQSLGYRQLLSHISGETPLYEAVEAIKRETRRFAKRQLTWFKRDGRIRWHDVCEYETAGALADGIQREFEEFLRGGAEA